MIELIILKVDLDQEVFLNKSVGFSIGNFYKTKQEHAFNFYVYHNCKQRLSLYYNDVIASICEYFLGMLLRHITMMQMMMIA